MLMAVIRAGCLRWSTPQEEDKRDIGAHETFSKRKVCDNISISYRILAADMASSELATVDPVLRRSGGLSVAISSAARSPELTRLY